jgi:glycosyltransferase involved in cell wall biosynthesis
VTDNGNHDEHEVSRERARPDSGDPDRAEGGARLTLVHDYLLVMRGAERTFAAMAELYTQAPIFTLVYDAHGTNGRFAQRQLTTSALQRLGVDQSTFRRLLPLYPVAISRLALPPSEVVLSSSSAFAHGVRVPSGAVHVCYCHAPFRYAWYEESRALAEAPAVLRGALRLQLAWMRRWDRAASRGVDSYVANSQLTRERIKRYYGRESTVIHPPVETHRFKPGTPGDALLVVSELVRHKRVHIALEAARRARSPITVVGTGPEQASLEHGYPEATFYGRAGDADLVGLYASARAVVVPSLEEFGIAAVEAQAAGRPVIAAAAGGALETVLDGRTGRLAALDDVDAFRQAIESIERLTFDVSAAVENAERFSVAAFRRRLSEHVRRALEARGRS